MTTETHYQPITSVPLRLPFLAEGGEMGQWIREFDWSKSPIGPAESWSPALRMMVRMLLANRLPMLLWWGPDYISLYNDAYRPVLGNKHPWALGQPVRECWKEIYHILQPLIDKPFHGGPSSWDEDILLEINRHGYNEETHFTIAYSPVPDESVPTGIGGVLATVHEITEKVVAERRMVVLRDLGSRPEEAKSPAAVCRFAAKALERHQKDIPFAIFYLNDADGKTAQLTASMGCESDDDFAIRVVPLDSPPRKRWPLAQLKQSTSNIGYVTDLSSRFAKVPHGPWSDPPNSAFIQPIGSAGPHVPVGYLIAGISSRIRFDEAYRTFLGLVANQVTAAITNAQAYEEEKRRTEKLAELDRAKTAFFSNVSHEFRTPLSLMLGPVEEILSRPVNDVPAADREMLSLVLRNGQRLQQLVNSFLSFSRIEAGWVKATYRPTDLSEVTKNVASMFHSACEKEGLRLSVDCPPLSSLVYVDAEMWEKIVLNLLSNAFKFTFDGGISVSITESGHHAILRVQDTGIGIPAREMPRLFERFHRIENSQGRTIEGTGIGLALVQELVKLHGGTIAAESVEGQGTTFVLSIPLGDKHLPSERVLTTRCETHPPKTSAFVDESLRSAPNQELGPSDLNGSHRTNGKSNSAPFAPTSNSPRLLIVDDNADMRQYIDRLLCSHYEIVTAKDGLEALDAVRTQRPDLILTDVMMPRLDGFGLLRQLRQDPQTSTIPVIMLTARAGEESRGEGIEAGADDYLIKPFSSRELLARVTSQLQMVKLRHEAGELLRLSEERLRNIFEHSSAGIAQIDVSGRFELVNQRLSEITGYSAEELRFKTCSEITHPDDRIADCERFYAMIDTLEPYVIEKRYVRKDQAIVWVRNSVSAIRDSDKIARHLTIVCTDITENKLAEEISRKRTVQLRRLADIATRLNAAVDVATVLDTVTDEARQLIGAHLAVTRFSIDQNWSQAVRSVSTSESYQKLQDDGAKHDEIELSSSARNSNAPEGMIQPEFEAESANQRSQDHCNGHVPIKNWLAAPLVDHQGCNIGLIQLSDKFEGDFSSEDESILVQLAQMGSAAIENANLVQDLREGDRRKDEFLATLAHELRNPLAPIRSGLQVMKLAADDSDAVQQSRSMMERQLNQMVHLVDDLLDLSRISRGKIELRKERIEISKVIQQAIETSLPAIDQAGHQLMISSPPSPIYVDADPTRLAQVFSNLLNNAAKYTERGGKIELAHSRQGKEVIVSIRDNGLGIPLPMLPLVFDMFTQVDRNLARAQGGLGIGLTIVKRLVEMHNGSVEARSAGDHMGSEFVVRLPLATNDALLGAGNEDSPNSTNRRRILVVDDNRDAATSLALLLKIMGNDVAVAHDGEEALNTASQFLPELILLDIGMPKLNGYETSRLIRQKEWGKEVFIVALTGWGQEDDRRKSHEAGFNCHMVKPIEPAALKKLLVDLGAKAATIIA